MSASLVGSEMCIRDSRLSIQWRPRAPVAHRALQRPEGERPPSHASEGPVSYTHLTLPTICSV
eukprot:11004788-Alexandrium_andersonii.AAC.1